MSRSPLAYPLNRGADTDVGGAADLQTDVMRFMAILALCLVAIFALVQSIPMAPIPDTSAALEATPPAPAVPETRVEELPAAAVPKPAPVIPPAAEKDLVLTRPQWTPKYTPRETAAAAESTAAVASEPPPPAPAAEPEQEGFTLRFASDTALMRAVAAHRVGVYAIESGRARRMTVSDSRISFWDASMPNAFHEMEPATVPVAVSDALARAGSETGAVNWGVTVSGRMKTQLDTLMAEHRGGTLIIGGSGDINWEALQ